MGLLKDADKEQLVTAFEQRMTGPVKILMFTQEIECEFCSTTQDLVKEVVELSDKISLEVYNFVLDKELVEKYAVSKIPALVLLGEGDKDYGIRFYGIPAGYEFTTLVEDIIDVSRGEHQLSEAVLAELAKIDRPIHIQALVSPTCPYCPKAVRTAHQFAMASEFITGDMVEVQEFPHLTVKYNVQGVPTTVINEGHNMVGAQPETDVVQMVLHVLGLGAAPEGSEHEEVVQN
jgi:glutaredoxin-like protein